MQLQEGWNLIPVLSSNNVGVEELFTDADIEIVKEVAGWRVYWPDLNINSMGTVNTGAAYFVLSNAEQTILFPDLDGTNAASQAQNELVNVTPWDNVTETPGSHVIGFDSKALTVLKEGDYIGAFTADDRCAGLARYDGKSMALAVYGDDPTTSPIDGFGNAEQFRLRVYRPETSERFDLDVTYSPDRNPGNFEAYGISEIIDMKLSSTGISGIYPSDFDIYPNPSSGIFYLESLYDNMSITVYDSYGNEILRKFGYQSDKIDLTQHANGVYYLRITTPKESIIKKLVKE